MNLHIRKLFVFLQDAAVPVVERKGCTTCMTNDFLHSVPNEGRRCYGHLKPRFP